MQPQTQQQHLMQLRPPQYNVAAGADATSDPAPGTQLLLLLLLLGLRPGVCGCIISCCFWVWGCINSSFCCCCSRAAPGLLLVLGLRRPRLHQLLLLFMQPQTQQQQQLLMQPQTQMLLGRQIALLVFER